MEAGVIAEVAVWALVMYLVLLCTVAYMLSSGTVSRLAPFDSLPRPLITSILILLPVNTRLRCSEVSRAWRVLLTDTVCWERLNFSVYDGGFSEALFFAAVAKAGGQLRELDVSARHFRLTFEALLNAVNANSQALQRLRLHTGVEKLSLDLVAQLCAAAPAVRELCADVTCRAAEAHALLRREPPFGALNIRSFTVQFTRGEDDNLFFPCAADLTLHGACLDDLSIVAAPLTSRAAWDALADVASSVRLTELTVMRTQLGPSCVPGLARLLREGSISCLHLNGAYQNGPLVDAEAVLHLSAALRANSTLSSLGLMSVSLWDGPAGIDLVDALVGHPTLESVHFEDSAVGGDADIRALAGAALGRLVAANSAHLTSLNVSFCALGDDGLRPLFAALPSNTHLFALTAAHNGISTAFAPVILASVKANQSLRLLHIDGQKQNENDPGHGDVSNAALREAEEWVVAAWDQGGRQ